MLPLPSRTHPKNQTPVVYTEELTHLTDVRNRPSGIKVTFRISKAVETGNSQL